MALNLLNGQMLNSTLERDGVNLSVVNTANSTPLIYLDIVNNRIGVNTTAANVANATAAFTITGNAFANNLYATSNISASGNVIAVATVFGGNANIFGTTTTTDFVATNNANAVNISASGNINAFANVSSNNISGNTVTTNSANVANLAIINNLSVTGTANINNLFASNFSTSGNSTASNLVVSGTVTANTVVALLDITAVGNIVGNVLSAVSNIAAPNVYASTIAVLPNITGLSNSNINLIHNGTGNINLDNISVRNTTLTSFGTTPVAIGGTAGLTLPYGNTSQRPSTPPTGTTRWNITTTNLETWDGVTWVPAGITAGAPGAIADQQFNGDGSTDTFTLNQSATNNTIIVSINGTLQIPGTAYLVTGNSITFGNPPLSGDTVDIRFIAYTATVSSLENEYGNGSVAVLADSTIELTTSSTVAVNVTPLGILQITGQSLQLPSYTVAEATAIATPQIGEVIYVSNGDTGSACLGVYDGSTWKRVALGATIGT